MCICLAERLQTDIWVWEAMVLDLPINQVLKDAVLGSAGHLACAVGTQIQIQCTCLKQC